MPKHDARSRIQGIRFSNMRWRPGGSVGRTIYAYEGEAHEHARDDKGWMIGVMDSAYLAHVVCDAHNERLHVIDGQEATDGT